MGNSSSCFDPVREHPPYSWPKNHPGRAEAIAEIKKGRRSRFSSTRGTKNEAGKDMDASPLLAGVEATKVKEEGVGGGKEDGRDDAMFEEGVRIAMQKKVVEEVKEKEVEVDGAKMAAATMIGDDEDGDNRLVVEEEKEVGMDDGASEEVVVDEKMVPVVVPVVMEDEEEVGMGDADVEEPLIEDVEDIIHVDEEKEVESEIPLKKEDVTVVAAAITTEEEKEEEETGAAAAIPASIDTDTKIDTRIEDEEKAIAKEDEVDQIDGDSGTIDDRRAMFENGDDDELPEAKDLKRDILDPVTNEYITLTEYRSRLKMRAQGVVKERVEEFEGVEDLASQAKAKLAAIEEARNEAKSNTAWSFKTFWGSKRESDAEGDGGEVRVGAVEEVGEEEKEVEKNVEEMVEEKVEEMKEERVEGGSETGMMAS